MNKHVDKGRPTAPAITIPYNLASLVTQTKALVERHVLSNVDELVRGLASPVNQFVVERNPWKRFVEHRGWLDPQGHIGLLDVHFQRIADGVRVQFVVREVVVDGDSSLSTLCATEMRLVTITATISDEGRLTILYASGDTPEWAEWVSLARTRLANNWSTFKDSDDISVPLLAYTDDQLACMLENFWSVGELKQIARDSALELFLVDEEREAEECCSSLDHTAASIWLITPYLAEALAKHTDAVCGTVLGLSIYSSTSMPDINTLAYDEKLQAATYLLMEHSTDRVLSGEPDVETLKRTPSHPQSE